MNPLHTSGMIWLAPGRASVDDAYSAWFNAQARCGRALEAWRTAPRHERADRHRVYVAELDIEDAAARELARACTRTYPRRPEVW